MMRMLVLIAFLQCFQITVLTRVIFVGRGNVRTVCNLMTSPFSCLCTIDPLTQLINVFCQCKKDQIVMARVIFKTKTSKVDIITRLPYQVGRRTRIESIQVIDCDEVVFRSESLFYAKGMTSIRLRNLKNLTLESGAFNIDVPRAVLSLEVANVANISLEKGAIAGKGFRRIDIAESTFSKDVGSGAISDVFPQEISFRNSEFDNIPERFISNSTTNIFEFSGNTLRGRLSTVSFELDIAESVEVSNTRFHVVSKDSFQGLKAKRGRVAVMKLSGLNISNFDIGALHLDPTFIGHVTFGSINTNRDCECQSFSREVKELLGTDGAVASQPHLTTSLKSNLLCIETGSNVRSAVKAVEFQDREECSSDYPDLTNSQIPETSLCDLIGCHCQSRSGTCDCNKAEGELKHVAIGRHPGASSSARVVSSFIPRGIKSIAISNCPRVDVKMARISRLKQFTLKNISAINLGSMKGFLRRSNVTNDLEFSVVNSTFQDSIKETTFCGAVFESIVIKDSSLDFIVRRSFADLSGIEAIVFDNVIVNGKVITEAFSNVVVNKFSVKHSKIQRVDAEAFDVKIDVQVGELFELRNTTVGKLGELSLARVRPVDASADAVVEISHLVMRHYEEGALIVDPFFLEGRSSFTGIVIDRPCDCDMFKVATNASLHHTAETTGVTEEISNLIKCKRKLRSRSKMLYNDNDRYMRWEDFDEENCHQHAGHQHHVHYDGKRLTVTNLVLYAVFGSLSFILVLMAVIIVTCWKARRPNIVPILPTGLDSDNWKAVSFHRADIGSGSGLMPPRPRSLGAAQRTDVAMTSLGTRYHTDPGNKSLHKVSMVSLEDDEVFDETETFVGDGLETLDIIRDVRLARHSLQCF